MIFKIFKALSQGITNKPDFNIKDSNGQTVLSYCLWNGMLALAKKLIGKILLLDTESKVNQFLNSLFSMIFKIMVLMSI